MRKYITIFILVASIASIVWIYFVLSESQPEYGNPWHTIPVESSCITEIRFSVPYTPLLPWLQEAASNKQLIGDVPFNPIATLPGFIEVLDSLHSNDEYWHASLENSPVLFASGNQVRGDQWMLVIPGQKGLDASIAQPVAQKLFGTEQWKVRSFNGTEIHESNEVGFSILHNCLVLSPVSSLLEAMVLHSSADSTLVMQDNFSRAHSSAAADCAIHFYYNLGDKEWLELDPETRQGKHRLTGFAFLNNHSKHRWSMSSTLATSNIASLLPPSVTILEGFVYPDFETGWKIQEDYMSGSGQQKFWSQAWKDLGDSCACDLNDAMLSWRSGEWGSCIIEDTDSSTTELLYFGAIDSTSFGEKMRPLLADSVVYNGHTIYRLLYPQLFDRNKSSLFLVESNYVLSISNYVFLASLPEDLYSLADAQSRSAFLSGHPDFKRVCTSPFISSHYLYHSKYLATDLPNALIKSFGTSEPLMTTVSRIDAQQFLVEINWPGGKQIANSESQQSSLSTTNWQFEASAAITAGPWVVKNHNTRESEIMVQDASGHIYLVGNDGKELWKLPVDGPILNAPVQVDALKNGKLQTAFATATRLYVVDRKGGMLPGFPVMLPSKASGELSVFDYEQNRNYRFVIGTTNGQLLNYNIAGKKTEGWIYETNDENVLFTDHIRVGNEDYIATTGENGTIRCYKRNGEPWKKLVVKTKDFHKQRPVFLPGTTIETTRVLLVGADKVLMEYNLKSGKGKNISPDIPAGSYISFADVNSDHKEDVVITHQKQLWVIDSSGDLLFKQTLSKNATSQPVVVKYSAMDIRYAIPVENNAMLILNAKAELVEEIISTTAMTTAGDFDGDSVPDMVGVEGQKIVIK